MTENGDRRGLEASEGDPGDISGGATGSPAGNGGNTSGPEPLRLHRRISAIMGIVALAIGYVVAVKIAITLF